jgi:tripartite-type tricarboxylate transporter receptor subunit TctC
MTSGNLSRRAFAALAAGAALAPRGGQAQAFPSRSIRFICPFPAGGIVDIVMRAFSDDVAAELGQPVVVDARPGAGGLIGSQALVGAQPDGHTWMMATLSHLVAPILAKSNFHPVNDVTGIAMTAGSVSVAAVPSSLPARTMTEFVRHARANPGKLNYLRPGRGSFGHLTVETLKLRTGIDVTAVDYSGLPPGILDLVAGRLDLGILSTGLAMPHVQEGKLRIIGTIGNQRAPEFPDMPTLTEQGVGDANLDSWYVVLAPKGVPAPIVERTHAAIMRALAKPEVQGRMKAAGALPVPAMSPTEVQALLKREYDRYAEVIEKGKIGAE